MAWERKDCQPFIKDTRETDEADEPTDVAEIKAYIDERENIGVSANIPSEISDLFAEAERTAKAYDDYVEREWANLSGVSYRYYMMFREKDLKWDGAVRFDRLIEIVKGL